MPWSKAQKKVIHRYAHAARMGDDEYREVLQTATGRRSAADRAMTQHDFDWAMAFIEQRLDYLIAEGFVNQPAWLRDRRHWRNRVARPGQQMSTRQRHEILERWTTLTKYIPAEKWHPRHDGDDPFWYLAAIASKAAGRPIADALAADDHVARLLIDALRQRCRRAAAA